LQRIDGFWLGASLVHEHVDVFQLAARVGGWGALQRADRTALEAWGVPPSLVRRWLTSSGATTAFKAIFPDSAEYPAPLAESVAPPVILFVDGDQDALRAPQVAVVGSRACTRYGEGVAHELGAQLAAQGVTVVSGLARGIDAAAHRGAVSAGRTVAVLAHGLAHTSPRTHLALRRTIVERGGALVSSWLDAVEPERYHFPRRNRWIAGLAGRLVVVEAGAQSGALYTVAAAREFGRPVYAVPGPIHSPASEGSNRVLLEGGTPLLCVREFVQEVTGRSAPTRELWLDLLLQGGDLGEASRVAGRSLQDLLTELARLEVEGQVVRLPGQRYRATGS
jgi:DNA processing protein